MSYNRRERGGRGFRGGFRGRGRGGFRGRGRGGFRGRGRGGRPYILSESAKRHLENIGRDEILTNFLPLKVDPDCVIHLTTAKLPKGITVKNKYGELEIHKLMKSSINRIFKDNDFIIRELSIISQLFVPDFRDLVVKIKVPSRLVERRRVVNYDSEDEDSEDDTAVEEESEECEGNDLILKIRFETEALVPREKDKAKLVHAYTSIVKFYLEKGRLFQEEYKVFSDRYIEKKPYKSSKEHRKTRIEDYFMDKEIHKAFSVNITKRDKSWYILIKPSWRIEKIYPNCLDLLDKFIDFEYRNSEIAKYFRSFKIRRLYYRHLAQELPISDIIFNLKAESRIDFETRGPPDQSFMDYIFGSTNYRDKIKRKGLRKDDIVPQQPMFEVLNQNRKEKYIPQLCEVNCVLGDENAHLQPFVTGVTNSGGLRQYLDRIVEILHFFRSIGLDKDLRRYGIDLDFQASLEKVRPKMVRQVMVEDQRGNSFHSTRQSYKWQRKMKDLTIKKGSPSGKEISFEHVMFLYHDKMKGHAQKLFNEIVINCEQRGIPFDQNTLMECDYTDQTKDGDWNIHMDRFEQKYRRLPKILICVTSLYRNDDQLYSDLVSFSAEHGIAEQFVRGQTASTKNERMIGLNLFFQLYAKLGGFLWNLRFESRSFFPRDSDTLIVGVSCLRQPQKKYYVEVEDDDDDVQQQDDNNKRRRRTRRRRRRICKVYPTIFCAVAVCPRQEWSRRISFLLPFSDQEVSGSAMKRAMNFFLGEWYTDFDQKYALGTVVLYRDGIPHTKFEKAQKSEIRVLEEILKERGVKLLYCVVQKRLNAMFFNHEADNPPCGSIVDETITFDDDVRKSFYINLDFFMVSTESNIHSTRPCHFILLKDDVNQEEEFKQVCFECCALYFNFPGCIKVPFALQLATRLSQKCSRSLFYKDKENHLKLNVEFLHIHSHSEKKSKLEENVQYSGDKYESESFVKAVFHQNSEEGMFEL